MTVTRTGSPIADEQRAVRLVVCDLDVCRDLLLCWLCASATGSARAGGDAQLNGPVDAVLRNENLQRVLANAHHEARLVRCAILEEQLRTFTVQQVYDRRSNN